MAAQAVFVVMAGGRGERLWPLVRAGVPKACVSVDGRRTLLEATLERIQPLSGLGRALIVTTQAQAGPIQRILPQAFRRCLLVEPEPKNTAACLTLAASALADRDLRRVMVVLPADQWVRPTAAFRRSLRTAIRVAGDTGRMVTIGVRPRRIHPGLGYLCAASQVQRRAGCRVFRLSRMVEKPSPQVVRQLIRHRSTYWNTGIFVGQVQTFVHAVQRWLPDHARRILPLGASVGRPSFARRAAAAYRGLRPVSFDNGVMVHLRDGYVVEGGFDWEDLGSWDSWVRMSRTASSVLTVGGGRVRVVSADGHLVTTAGLEDVIVVHTPDATLVCRADATQSVRDVVTRLSRDPRLSRYL